MTEPLHVVFCADRRVVPGLHVAAYSLLERMGPGVAQTRFTIFSEAWQEADVEMLHQTLHRLAKPYTLELRRVEADALADFPLLNGSAATYYRLFATQIMEVDRFLYVDADTMCDVDVSGLQFLDMGNAPAGWVQEAPMDRAVDRTVAEQLGNDAQEFYFNAGVMLVNVSEWRRQKISERALEYITLNHPLFHDQSALNVVLHQHALTLDAKFNCVSNMRKNWPVLKRPYGMIGRLVHFVDYPKPWDLLGEIVHPQYALWRSVLDKTALANFRSWHPTPARRWPLSAAMARKYKKLLRDRILFDGYRRGWLRRVKGVSPV